MIQFELIQGFSLHYTIIWDFLVQLIAMWGSVQFSLDLDSLEFKNHTKTTKAMVDRNPEYYIGKLVSRVVKTGWQKKDSK